MFTFPECTLLSQLLQFQWFCFPKQRVISFEVSGLHNTISVTGHFSFSAAIHYLASLNLCFNEWMFSRQPLLLPSLTPGASVCIVLVWFQYVCLIWQDGNTAGRKASSFKQMLRSSTNNLDDQQQSSMSVPYHWTQKGSVQVRLTNNFNFHSEYAQTVSSNCMLQIYFDAAQ